MQQGFTAASPRTNRRLTSSNHLSFSCSHLHERKRHRHVRHHVLRPSSTRLPGVEKKATIMRTAQLVIADRLLLQIRSNSCPLRAGVSSYPSKPEMAVARYHSSMWL